MKGYRFYLEYKVHDTGNVVAIIPENSWVDGDLWVDAIAAIKLSGPNSAVSGTVVMMDYVRENCKRISEKRAREIHPALFEYLDYNP